MKYSINFLPEKCKNNPEEGNVRMIIQWSGGGRLAVSVGHKVVLAKWSKDAQRCKQNTTHGQFTSTRINKDIQKYEDDANAVMQSFEDVPTATQVKDALALRQNKATASETENLLRDIQVFITEQSKLKSWAFNTIKIFTSIRRVLKKLFETPRYMDILTEDAQDRLIVKLQDYGLKNSTVRSYIDNINYFLRWAEKKKLIKKAPNYAPSIKTVNKKVIYLTKEELLALFNFKFDKIKARTRDMFCFCCFTGLRYSDALALRKENISGDYISLVSKKDTDALTIELNKFSRAILSRVQLSAEERAAGCVLPQTHISSFNRELRLLCQDCGIDEPIKIVYYKGGKRVEETKLKYELISSHVGRKTFICTALSHNIAPNIIMKWTGHSSYDAMKPYIDVTSEAKKNAMTAFDSLV